MPRGSAYGRQRVEILFQAVETFAEADIYTIKFEISDEIGVVHRRLPPGELEVLPSVAGDDPDVGEGRPAPQRYEVPVDYLQRLVQQEKGIPDELVALRRAAVGVEADPLQVGREVLQLLHGARIGRVV